MVKKLSFIALTLVLALLVRGQEWKLKLSSNVEIRTWKLTSTYEKEERSLQGAKIVLSKGGSVVEETSTDGNGDFSIMVPPNGDYLLTVSYAGYNTKRFSVNTTGVPDSYNNDKSWKPTFSIGGFIMARAYPGIDYSGLEQPLVKVEWKAKKKVFDHDDVVTTNGIATVTKIYESEMALIQKFCGLNKQGDVALAKPDCPLAKKLYQEAMALITFETYPVNQLQKVGDCLKNQNQAAEEAAKKAAAEKAAAEKAAADKIAADKAAAEKAAADKVAKEAAAKSKAEADAKAAEEAKLAAEAKAKEKAEIERKKKEGLAASKAEDEAAEKAAQEKRNQKEKERLEAEAKAAEEAKLAAEAAKKEKAEIERKKKEGLAASKAEDEAAEKAALEKKRQKDKEKAEAEAKAKAEDSEEAKKIAAEKEAKRKAKEEEDEQKRKQAEAEAANDPNVKGNAKYGLYGVLGEDKYKNTIKKADDYFKMKRWSEAKTAYEEALTYKKDDAYATSKLEIVNKNLAPK
jgi:hypothetical protein